jgi:hypothetical protein
MLVSPEDGRARVYGDTAVVRRLAREMREQAADIHGESAALLARAEGVPWSGMAADAMRLLARDHAAGLAASARAHEDAAAALERHARDVEHAKALIAAAERRVQSALDTLGRGATELLHTRVAHWLAHADLPSPGHLGWLEVRIPRWLP